MVRRRASRREAPEEARDAVAVRAAAQALLARRDYARAELHARLAARGFEAAVVEQVLLEFEGSGILDDARFAQNYVTWHAGRGQGPIRIGAELKRLGVSGELVQAALGTESEWRAHALRVRLAKFGRQAPASWAAKARQARFLQYRGFSADHIRAAIGADLDLD
jgi:regulatory protein